VISLPNTGAEQAQQVAQRIRETMFTLTVRLHDYKTIPVPTISQGLAVFPREANTTIDLIHLADKRLYVAKERGRDQIEPPDAAQWQMLLAKTTT
jgi:diguanylate cyclase (GGDEF)-like protein